MRNIMVISCLFVTQLAMGQIVNTSWQYNSTKCVAQTMCPNGRLIRCATVGYNYGNAPRVPVNMCRTRVIPGRLVHCQGYADKVGPYGRITFVPANYPLSCY